MMKRKNTRLIKFLQARGETLALAESMTAGLACHKLAGVKGAFDVLKGGIVCYDARVKNHLLGISQKLIDTCTPESQEVTDALARQLSKKMNADVYAAITGLAAPGGSETKSKPVGTVFFAVLYRNKIYHKRVLYRGSPVQVRKKACDGLFDFILETLG